jgi:hypothetical protein
VRYLVALLAAFTGTSTVAADVPDYVTKFTRKYCVKCHGTSQQKGDFRIDQLSWKLIETESRDQWDLLREYVADGDMPPKKASKHPDAKTVKQFIERLDQDFAHADQTARPGGTPLRRLNRVEYLNTVRDLFGIRMVDLPLSFPEDATDAEFDTMPEGLFLSPAVLEGYHDVATDIANRLVPLPGPKTYRSSYTVEQIGGDQGRRWFSKSKDCLKFTGVNNSGWAGALWDSIFIASECGQYKVRLLANAQAETGADSQPLRLTFHAFDPTEEQLPKRYLRNRATKVAQVDIPSSEPAWIECAVPLEAGETFHVYCDNRFAPGVFPDEGVNRGAVNKAVKDAIKHSAPTVELRGLEVQGPVDVLPRIKEYFGEWPPKLNRSEVNRLLLPLASKAYRRPLSDAEKENLISSALSHRQEVSKTEYAWHYAIRRLLCSPGFLYREEKPQGNRLDDFALASRLSYFLWSTMPDEELLGLAKTGMLSDVSVLKDQVQRLLNNPKSSQFTKHFTGQWLGNRTVELINVCDNRYVWNDLVRYGFVRSTELFFEEVLRQNKPISTFIDSDFTYANSPMRIVWGFKEKRGMSAQEADQRQSLVWPEPTRINLNQLPPNTPIHVAARGGILGLPGVLTVTGDGVESSPILRGVWVLENMFGHSPPPPPKDVPALDIDTSQATSIRETLAAHKKLESCASCHRDIDPPGLALENYDAIGGWRTSYPGNKQPIDTSSEMTDGTILSGPQSIKDYLKANPKLFTRCLLSKLLEYGAGRQLSVGDRRIVDQIVETAPENGYRFRDLIEAAVTSEVFLTR